MRRGQERYAPAKGYDIGSLARQKLSELVVRKAGIFPGDRVLDVHSGTGLLGVNVARAFTRAKVVATDADIKNLRGGRDNAVAERCRDRMDFVLADPTALPFKEETFFFATVGLGIGSDPDPEGTFEEIHRVTGFTGKVYVPDLELGRLARKPRGVRGDVFDADLVEALREMGFAKVQRVRVASGADGVLVNLVMMKRFDPDEIDDEDEEDDEDESAENAKEKDEDEDEPDDEDDD